MGARTNKEIRIMLRQPRMVGRDDLPLASCIVASSPKVKVSWYAMARHRKHREACSLSGTAVSYHKLLKTERGVQ